MLDGQQWAGLLTLEQVELAEEAVSSLCGALRPDACSLVDAWDFDDMVRHGWYCTLAALGSPVCTVQSPPSQGPCLLACDLPCHGCP